MQLDTARFGALALGASDLLFFPEGLIGFEDLHAWSLLREGSLCWLQAVEDPTIALPVVSPFCHVANYRLRLREADCRPLEWESPEYAVVLAVVAQQQGQWTLNLRAPLLVRPDLRRGRQVIASGEHSLQHVLPRTAGKARKSA